SSDREKFLLPPLAVPAMGRPRWRNRMRIHPRSLIAALGVSLAPRFARAATPVELRIRGGTEGTTMDPHFYNLTPNSEATAEVFDTLVWAEHDDKVIPWLAESWSRENDTHWIFK